MPDEIAEEIEKMKLWGLSINAHKNFNDFINAIQNNSGITEECRKIYGILDLIVFNEERDKFINHLCVGQKLYRARIIDPEDYGNLSVGVGIDTNGLFSGYNGMNSCEPILGKGGDGRNNIAGMPYLYVASNEETACAEIKSQLSDLISLAEFEVKKQMNIIDFSSDKTFEKKYSELHDMSLGVFFTQLMMQYCVPIKDNSEYRATQLVSEYIRKTGVDGIAYKSFLSPGGVNYTIFHSHCSLIEFQSSRVLIHKQANHSFWDFNNDKAIYSNGKNEQMEYNQEIAEDHKKHLRRYFNTQRGNN